MGFTATACPYCEWQFDLLFSSVLMVCMIGLSAGVRPAHPVSSITTWGLYLAPVLSGLRSSAEHRKLPRQTLFCFLCNMTG